MNDLEKKDISLFTIAELENLICELGLVYDSRFNYGDKYQKYMKKDKHGGLYQIPRQFAEFLFFLSKRKIKSVFNIGTHNGWTITLLTHYLQCIQQKSIHVTSIDIKTWPYKDLPNVGINFQIGTSDNFVGQVYDLCIVDGCHLYDWVKKDYENVGKYAKICMFHDVNDQFCPGVVQFYKEVSVFKSHNEFLYHPHEEKVMGIGVIEKLCFI